MVDKAPKTDRTASQEIVVASSELAGKIKQLVAGGTMITPAPVLAPIGTLAAVVAEFRPEVVREGMNYREEWE